VSENKQHQVNRDEQRRHDCRMVFVWYDFVCPLCYVCQHRAACICRCASSAPASSSRAVCTYK
jgi:hypothetical protein